VTVIQGARRTDVPGIPVHFVKGLGGGDGFLSGFMFGYLRGWNPVRAAALGNVVGAMVVRGHACSESMPRPRELKRFIKEKGMDIDLDAGTSKG
jgi:5-dehydro-2-deoxygluconokinase